MEYTGGINSTGSIVSFDYPATDLPDSRVVNATPSALAYKEMQIVMVIAKWLFPTVILLGTVGNVLAFIVLLRKRMRITSVNIYLLILACADTGVLYSNAFRIWIGVMTNFHLQHTSPAGCKLVTYCFLVSIHMSAWLVVAISADRFVAVWFPFKSLILCTVKRAQLISLIGFLVLVAYNSHVFWTVHLQYPIPGGRPLCGPLKDDFFANKVYPWLKLTTYSCAPFLIVLFLNICIISKVWFGVSQKNYIKNSKFWALSANELRVTTMLLAVSICWLVLTAPFTLWSFAAKPTNDPHLKSRNMLAKIICFLFMYLNHSINFYLYCLTGRNFRREFRDCIRCRPQNFRRRSSSLRITFLANSGRKPNNSYPEFKLIRDEQKKAETKGLGDLSETGI